jgi:hypothetical protein
MMKSNTRRSTGSLSAREIYLAQPWQPDNDDIKVTEGVDNIHPHIIQIHSIDEAMV